MKFTVYYVAGLHWDKETQAYFEPSIEEIREAALANLLKNIGGNRNKGYNGIYLRESAAKGHAARYRLRYYKFEFDLSTCTTIEHDPALDDVAYHWVKAGCLSK